MVFLNLTKHLNQWLGPFMLRNGLKARYLLGRGVIRDSPHLDAILGIPLAQKLISIEVHDECQQAVTDGLVKPSWRDSLTGKSNTYDDNNDNTTAATATVAPDDSELRVQVLEKYLRPALIKNEQWSNVRTWQFHNRMLKWARTEMLLAKHGPDLRAALDAFPAVGQSPQLKGSRRLQGKTMLTQMMAGQLPFDEPGKKNNTVANKLPTTDIVQKAFGLHNWSAHKDHSATNKDMGRIAKQLNGDLIELRGKSLPFVDAPADQDVSTLSLEEILQVAGGHVTGCGPLNALCEEADIYQLWTKDYIETLGKYLLKQTASFAGETVVLDVGAGDGLLAQSLRDFLKRPLQPKRKVRPGSRRSQPVKAPQALRRPGKIPSIVATDDGSWSISSKASVEKLSVEESIARYASDEKLQVIVLCSWMPMSEDWSATFREGGVDEYILIGECDDGQCGENWLTWGNRDFLPDAVDIEFAKVAATDDNDTDGDKDNNAPASDDMEPSTPCGDEDVHVLFDTDGYVRKDLDELLSHQFSRFDCAVSKFGRTVSFRKKDRS